MPIYHIGVDLHKIFMQVVVMEGSGKIVDNRRIDTSPEAIEEYFKNIPKPSCVTIEATWGCYWVCDKLQSMGFDVKLAHPRNVKLISESKNKNDKVDGKVLADLERTNFLPEAYIPSLEIRNTRELLRYRMSLVNIRIRIKNKVHAALAKAGIVNHGYTDLFGTRGLEFLKSLELHEVYRNEINGYIELLDKVGEIIKGTEKSIMKYVKEESPEARLLITIPGISYFSALLIAMEIGDISRFMNYRKLCRYAGLVCSTRESGDKVIQGHIVKESNQYIRWCLVEAARKAKAADPRLKRKYDKMYRKSGHNKAVIVVARKMLVSIYFMLKNKTEYRIDNTNKSFRVSPGANLAA